MKGLKKTGNFLSTVVNVLFGGLMVLILYGTVVLDKSIEAPYPNTALRANGAYYLFALILLWILYRALYARRNHFCLAEGRQVWTMTSKQYYCALVVMALAVAALQYFIARWMPLAQDYFKPDGDFGSIVNGARAIADGGSLEGMKYFQRSPNNLNVTIVVSFVYRLLDNPRAAVWLGALLTNASMVLASLAVYNHTRRGGLALAVGGLGEVLVALSWRAFFVYTDNYGMIFIALMIWLYTTNLRSEIKVPLITLFAACGGFIKITCAIIYAALAVNGMIKWLRGGERRLNLRRMALYTLSAALLFGGMLSIQGPVRRHYGYVPGKYPKGWQYMFMVGQNTEGFGAVGGDNGDYRNAFIKEYKDIAQVNRAFLKRAISFIRERGLWGNLDFYEKKLTHIYNDGYFHNVQRDKMYEMEKSLLYSLYLQKGEHYQVTAGVFQTLWDLVLLTLTLHTLYEFLSYRRNRREKRLAKAGEPAPEPGNDGLSMGRIRDTARLMKISILAITLFLLCVEGRSKYLYMFMPVFMTAFGLMAHPLGLAVSEAAQWIAEGAGRSRIEQAGRDAAQK